MLNLDFSLELKLLKQFMAFPEKMRKKNLVGYFGSFNPFYVKRNFVFDLFLLGYLHAFI